VNAKARPKRVRLGRHSLKLSEKRKAESTTVSLLSGGTGPKPTDNGKIQRRRNPAKKTKKATKTANELMLEAWKYTYENRHRRLTRP